MCAMHALPNIYPLCMPFACGNVGWLGFGIDLVIGLYLKLPKDYSSWWFGFVPGVYIGFVLGLYIVQQSMFHLLSIPTNFVCLFVWVLWYGFVLIQQPILSHCTCEKKKKKKGSVVIVVVFFEDSIP
jgi:hypothetical protein